MMTNIDQGTAATNGAAPAAKHPLIPYAGKEPPALKHMPPGTFVDGVDCSGMTDDPRKAGVPPYLQAQNRKPLTAEQQAGIDAKMAAARLTASHNSALAARKPALTVVTTEKPKTKAQLEAEKKAARKAATAAAKAEAKTAAKAKRDAKTAAPKAGKKKDGPTIGGVANEAILAGKSNEEALAAVMKAFPKCKSNLSCISWYRGKLRESGQLKGAAAARSAPAVPKAAPKKDKPAAKAKSARIKVDKKASPKKAAKARPTKGGKGR